jgi:hypothetical protein
MRDFEISLKMSVSGNSQWPTTSLTYKHIFCQNVYPLEHIEFVQDPLELLLVDHVVLVLVNLHDLNSVHTPNQLIVNKQTCGCRLCDAASLYMYQALAAIPIVCVPFVQTASLLITTAVSCGRSYTGHLTSLKADCIFLNWPPIFCLISSKDSSACPSKPNLHVWVFFQSLHKPRSV